ncbi:LOW QUALITY PROTEIN: cation channel sperm-associated auxiliary subunit epsilon [Theristicus caerulescens]
MPGVFSSFTFHNNVTNVPLTDNGIIFLINGTFYKEANNFFKLGAEHNLPESEVTGIHSRYWCSSVCPVQIDFSLIGKQLSTLAAWTLTEFYLGYNETFNKMGDTANLVNLNFPNTASLSIEAVSYDSVPSEITLLLICNGCSSSRLFFLAVYNEDRQFWGLRNFYLPVPRSSAMRMIYIHAALSSGLLWDDVAFTTPTKTTQIMDIFNLLPSCQPKEQMKNMTQRSYGHPVHRFTVSLARSERLKRYFCQANSSSRPPLERHKMAALGDAAHTARTQTSCRWKLSALTYVCVMADTARRRLPLCPSPAPAPA